ncbi:uncharacterized protein LOC142329945 isoform X2 [Lycorma delicatula]|uniref:uncharacterized protein LOC142329945 isoform X2 n=1 Tax=Lycorma delicatula TaxID=130591 RepID=UPI003F516F6B
MNFDEVDLELHLPEHLLDRLVHLANQQIHSQLQHLVQLVLLYLVRRPNLRQVVFGNTAPAPAFGQPQTMQPSFGAFGSTAGGGTTVKFTLVIGTDTMVKNRVTQTGRTSS